MKVLLIALVILIILSACGKGQDYAYAKYNRMAYDDCVFYGFTPGTDPFAYCMMRRGAARPNAGFR